MRVRALADEHKNAIYADRVMLLTFTVLKRHPATIAILGDLCYAGGGFDADITTTAQSFL
jgi:hypothetical protein